MPLPGEAPPISNEFSNQQLSHLDTPRHLHMSHKILWIPHSSSSFWWGNISLVLVTLFSWIRFISMFFISVFTVSVMVSFISCVLHCCACPLMPFTFLHVHSHNNHIINFSDDKFVIQRCVEGAQGEKLLQRVSAAQRTRPTYGGYLLCGDTDHL